MGFGDFLKGAAHAGGNLVGDVVGATENVGKAAAFTATHLDDIAKATGKGVAFAGEHVGEMAVGTAKGVGWLTTHPQYWDDAAKQMIKDQLTPQNLAITAGLIGLTVATGGAGGAGLFAKAAEGVEEVGAVARATKVAVEGAQEAQKLGRFAKFAEEAKGVGTGIKEARGLQKIDRAMSAFGDIKGAARQAVGLSEKGLIQQGRTALAEKMLPGVEEGTAGAIQKAAFRKIEGGYGQARSAAQTSWSSASERAGFLGGKGQSILNAPSTAVRYRNYLHMAAHPEDISGNIMRAGENYALSHRQEIFQAAGKLGVKSLMGGGEEEEVAPRPTQMQPLVQPTSTPTLQRDEGMPQDTGGRTPRFDDSGQVDLAAAAQMGRIMGRGAWRGTKRASRWGMDTVTAYQKAAGGKPFREGRSELSGITSSFDWRDMGRPPIVRGKGAKGLRQEEADRNGRRGSMNVTNYNNYVGTNYGQVGQGNVGIWANGPMGFHPGEQQQEGQNVERVSAYLPRKALGMGNVIDTTESPGFHGGEEAETAPAGKVFPMPAGPVNQEQTDIGTGEAEPGPLRDPYKRGPGAYGGVYRKPGLGNFSLGDQELAPTSTGEPNAYESAYFGHLQQP